MKKILYGNDAKEAILRGVEKIANAVNITLGPKGKNVALKSEYSSPVIINDGVSIAKEVVLSEVEQLQQDNKKLKERIEYLERSNNRREDTIIEQRQEISDLEDNWNKLKKYIKTEIPEDAFIDTEWFVSILDKMQELEGSNE